MRVHTLRSVWAKFALFCALAGTLFGLLSGNRQTLFSGDPAGVLRLVVVLMASLAIYLLASRLATRYKLVVCPEEM